MELIGNAQLLYACFSLSSNSVCIKDDQSRPSASGRKRGEGHASMDECNNVQSTGKHVNPHKRAFGVHRLAVKLKQTRITLELSSEIPTYHTAKYFVCIPLLRFTISLFMKTAPVSHVRRMVDRMQQYSI